MTSSRPNYITPRYFPLLNTIPLGLSTSTLTLGGCNIQFLALPRAHICCGQCYLFFASLYSLCTLGDKVHYKDDCRT